MAHVQVIQRDAYLAAAVKLEYVVGREGRVARGVLTAISNVRRGPGEAPEAEVTAVQWTLWGRQAEWAAEYLGKGAHVNVLGRLRDSRYQDAQGKTVYALGFTCEEIDYLDSRHEAQARRRRRQDAAPR